jgi:nucleoside-diphosphate-sugar epimerase
MTDHSGPVNIGNPREQSLLEIAQLIADLTGGASKIVMQPRPIDDPQRRQPDISLALSTLDWKPLVSAEEGLTRTIEWFKTLA